MATARASLESVLFTAPAPSSRTRAASLGCTTRHPFPGCQQLLRQQVPQPAGAFHRPGPLRPLRCPLQQPLRLGRRGPYPYLARQLLVRADRHRCVRAFVRVHPDHHYRHDRLLPFALAG
jgi:hypothetical protein